MAVQAIIQDQGRRNVWKCGDQLVILIFLKSKVLFPSGQNHGGGGQMTLGSNGPEDGQLESKTVSFF